MTTDLHLSKKSKKFLEDLRVYLFSSGKNEQETAEIVEELATHLSAAEENGKSIEKVIGDSPKAYMESVSKEMPVDYKTWIKYMFIFIFGAFTFLIADDLLEGTVAFSVLESIGSLIITIISILTLFVLYKFISSKGLSDKKIFPLLAVWAIVQLGLFVGLIFVDRAVETPMIEFGFWGSLILGILVLIFVAAVSIWAKTFILIVVITFTTLPAYFLNMTNLQLETQLIVEMVIMYGGIGSYLLFYFLKEKKVAD